MDPGGEVTGAEEGETGEEDLGGAGGEVAGETGEEDDLGGIEPGGEFPGVAA